MNEQFFGQVVPFALSAAKIRRGAHIRRRQGSHIEATELLRQAALREDSSSGWLMLAQQLRSLGCWEQASTLLLRLLARDEILPETWLELGRCLHALGRTELAVDCYYHYLQEDPYSSGADEARMTLSDLEAPEHVHEPLRLTLLIRRGLIHWQEGRREAALRSMRRALRMTRKPERLHITLCLLHMAEGDFASALKHVAAVIRRDPANPRGVTTLATLLSQMDKPRMARAFLRRCIPLCQDAPGEDMYLSAGWAISALRETEEYLNVRLRRYPHRITLLHALADLCWDTGRQQKSFQIWQRILRLDPDDRRARMLLKWGESHPETLLPVQGALPWEAIRAQFTILADALSEGMSPEELIRLDTPTRAVMDWCMTLPDPARQSSALSLILSSEHPAVTRYLRELLLMPSLLPDIRQCVLVRLAELGQTGPMHMLMGPRIMQVQCQPTRQRQKGMWKIFLPVLLKESRFWQQSEQIAGFAAALWPLLSRAQHEAAAGHDCICWAKAIEVLYLQMTDQEESALLVMDQLDVSPRRVRRILRAITAKLEITPEYTGNE